MKRLSVVVLDQDRHDVLRGLGRLGAVHLVRSRPGPDTAPEPPPDRSADLGRCDTMLDRIAALARRLDVPVTEPPPDAVPEIDLAEAERRLDAVEGRTREPLERQASLRRQWGEVTAMLAQVEGFETLDVPVEDLGRLSFLHFAIGSLPEQNLPDLADEVGENVVLVPLATAGGEQRLVAVTSRKGRFALETALEQEGFSRRTPETEEGGSLADVADGLRRRRDDLAAELERTAATLDRLSAEVGPVLGQVRAVVRTERRILEAEEHFPRTHATSLITGWVPAEEVGLVRRRLRDLIGNRCVIETADAGDVPEDEVPVLLKHPRLLRPFQMLVSAYGLPGYRDLEPTLFVAITFLGMFGMMFGDIGHGGVLAVGGVLAALYGRSRKVRDGGVLLTAAGAASIVFGFVYGECFGIELEGLALWHSPLEPEGTMAFIWTAIAVGIGVITLGLVLNIVNRFRRGEWLQGLLDRTGVVGGVFYWASVALFLRWGVQQRSDLNWLFAVLIVGALVALLVREPLLRALYHRRGESGGEEAGEGGAEETVPGLVETIFESVIEVFETVLTYLSNTISFVRLAAYAMSHTAILVATFLLADEVAKAAGAVGGPLGVLIIILGNAMAIALEGIIASVQALRLEWYEFFSKFYTGGGRAFEPFRLTGSDSDSNTQG
jgi:V/A-type H+-transporting ATPase subunit I